jgi:hypothetical protein
MALESVHRTEREIADLDAKQPLPLGEKERGHLMQLGADLKRAWSHPAASAATRKRILRAALKEIIARVEDGFIEMVLHWQGGDHTELKFKMNTARLSPPKVATPSLASPNSFPAEFPLAEQRLVRMSVETGSSPSWAPIRASIAQLDSRGTSSVHTLKLASTLGPNVVAMATSMASRPLAISTRPIRGTLLRGSKVYQRPPR